MRSRSALVILIVLVAAAPARAQGDFATLPAQVGDVVYVTDLDGVEVRGRITDLSATTLTIDEYAFKPTRGLKIERPGDSLMNGTLIGFGIGAAIGAALHGEACAGRTTCGSRGAQALAAGVSYAGFGAFIDWLRVGRKQIYRGTGPRFGRKA
jgi:hypothetical protein